MVKRCRESSRHHIVPICAGCLSALVSVPAAFANRLETFVFDVNRNRIEFATQEGIRPVGQIIDNPTRLVIDLPGATYRGPTIRRRIGTAVEAVRVGNVEEGTTRLVVEFSPQYNLDVDTLKLRAGSSTNQWSIQLPASVAAASVNAVAPFAWPLVGTITAGFGWRIHPITGDRRLHRGIDIASPIGTPVFAARDGKVTYAQWDDGGYGNLLEITHADGSRTLYAHLDRFLTGEGQMVRQGQPVAEVGTTGRSTGPHLHFEVQPDGKAASDPLAFLPQRYIVFDVASL